MLISSERTHGCSPEPCSPHGEREQKMRWKYKAKVTSVWPLSKKTPQIKWLGKQQERLTLPWVTLPAVWGSGSVCYSSLTLQPLPVSSHSGKWFGGLVKTEGKMDKIHPWEFTQEVFVAGASGRFICTYICLPKWFHNFCCVILTWRKL